MRYPTTAVVARESIIQLLHGFKRSRTFKVGASYFVVAWLLIQVADILLENFAAPGWIFRTLVLLLAAGFPVALLVAWSQEFRHRRRASAVAASPTLTSRIFNILSVVTVAAMAGVLGWLAWGTVELEPDAGNAPRAASIAVLPFSDMSAEGDQKYFAHGLSEEILNLLAGIRELKVSGRTSSFSFEDKDVPIPEIGDALGVAHVLEGSVRKSGDRVRITAQLIDTEDGFHVWSKNFDRRLTDIFVIQDEIAGAIASALRLSLIGDDRDPVGPESTDSIETYDRFLEARQLIQDRSVAGLERARELLDEALARDSEFAPALAQQALAWLMLSDARTTPGDEPFATAVARAETLLERALKINPELASAYAVRGLMLTLQRNFDAADRALVRALEVNPSHSDALNWRAINLRNAGRLRDELEVRRQLLEIDPLHLSNLFNLSVAHLLRGQTDQALEVARRLKRDFPGSPWGDLAEVEALMGSGRLARAQELAREKLADGNSILVSSASSVNMRLGCFEAAIEVAGSPFGLALAGQERFEEAIAAARDSAAANPGDSNSSLSLLRVLSLAGRHESLLEYYDQRWGSLDALQAYFGFEDMTAEVAPIATAQARLGQTEALEQTLAHWRARLADPREQGYALPYFHFIEAGFQTLSGNRESALALLEQSIEGGYLNPMLGIEPEFHELREDPEFQRLTARNLELINAEREKLGGCGN